MGMHEWLSHYVWQGVDLIVLLDNNSTDSGPLIAKKFSNVIVLPAPKNNAQIENYYAGYLELVKQNVDFVAVLDLDEYMFGKYESLKKCVERYARKGYSQISVNWAMFGSNKFLSQPASIRKSFVKRKRNLQTNQKSIWKISDLIQLHVHKSEVRGKSLILNSEIQLNHYIIQSREYFQKVKMPRGDVHSKQWNTARTWDYFDAHDFDDVNDYQLSNLMDGIIQFNHTPHIEEYWGIFEFNPTSWIQSFSYLPIGIAVVLFILFFFGGSRLLTLWCALHFILLNPKRHETNQIRRNKLLGNIIFALLTAASIFIKY
jgi:hypothetical protein